MGITNESIAAVDGPAQWTENLLKVHKDVVVVNVESDRNTVAFAGNALFGAVETVASPEQKLASATEEKLDIALLPTGAMQVKPESVRQNVRDEIISYRATMTEI